MIGGSAIKGQLQVLQLVDTWGAVVGAIGGAAGTCRFTQVKKARAAESLNTQRFATNTNRKFLIIMLLMVVI
jgi:hypothetical protein